MTLLKSVLTRTDEDVIMSYAHELVANRDRFLLDCCSASLYGLTPKHKHEIPSTPPNTVFAIAKAFVIAVEDAIKKAPRTNLEGFLRVFDGDVIHRRHRAPITVFWRLRRGLKSK